MTATQSLALFKSPVARGGFSTDSALPPRADHRSRRSFTPQPVPAALTQSLPDTENTLLLAFAALIVPSVIYSVLQMSHLISNGVLENAIRAFAHS